MGRGRRHDAAFVFHPHPFSPLQERPDLEFGRVWLREKVRNAAMLGKPLVLEEFGKAASGPFPQSTPDAQMAWYKTVYDAVAASTARGTGLVGVMFWRWAATVDGGADLGAFDRGSMVTSDNPVYTQVIAPFSADVVARDAKRVVKGCTKDGGAAPTAPPRKAGAKPASDGGVSAASTDAVATAAGVGPVRRLAGWADTSDIDVSQLAVQLPGGYRPAGLSGPWAGATSSQLQASWNPEFVTNTTTTAPATSADDPPPPPPKAKPAATPAPTKPAATPAATTPANKTAAAAAPIVKPTPAATPVAAPAPADGGRAVASTEPRLVGGGSVKIDMDALNRKVTCAA